MPNASHTALDNLKALMEAEIADLSLGRYDAVLARTQEKAKLLSWVEDHVQTGPDNFDVGRMAELRDLIERSSRFHVAARTAIAEARREIDRIRDRATVLGHYGAEGTKSRGGARKIDRKT